MNLTSMHFSLRNGNGASVERVLHGFTLPLPAREKGERGRKRGRECRYC